jgi:leader peptidase (prepilin peptidase)/N-methyltransferase
MQWVWPLLIAPFVGSFLGVLTHRLVAGTMLASARSRCEACRSVIAPWDLVPLFSFAVLRGRCRACGARIAARHWHIELAAVAVALVAIVAEPDVGTTRLWLDCGFGWALLALGWIDWDAMILPDVITLPLVVVGLGATLWLDPAATTGHAIAAATGYAAFRIIAIGYRALRGRDGLGEGDAKLLAALGAWIGLDGLPWVVFGGAMVGLSAAMVMSVRGRRVEPTTRLPFGCCLALAGWVIRLHT